MTKHPTTSSDMQDMRASLMHEQSSRRGALMSMGLSGLASIMVYSPDILTAAEDTEKKIAQTASEHARAESHPKDAFKIPRWKPARAGNYNLSDARDNHFAFAKAQANLAGEYSWLAKYGWILIAPPGKPAYPFLGQMTLAKIFLTATDPSWAPDVGEDDYTMWGTFTTTHFDPRTFAPVSRLMNPYTGKMIDAPTFHYADRLIYRFQKSIIVPGVDPKFYDQPWDRDGGYSQHFIDAGQEITYTVLGSSQFDGPHQPRCDVGFWTVRRDELMDPNMRSINTRRDYSVIQKMTEYSWYGAASGDQAQIFSHSTALKTQDVTQMPGLVKTGILDRFPNRYA